MKGGSFIKWQVIIVVCSRCATVGLGLLFTKFMTNYVSENELGIYYVLLTLSYFFNALLFVPLDYFQQANLQSIINNGFSIASYNKLNKDIIKRYCFFSLGLVLIVYFINSIYSIYAFICTVLALAIYITTLLKNLMNNLNYRSVVCFFQVTESLAKLLILFLLMMYINNGTAIELTLTTCIALFLSVVISLILMKNLKVIDYNKPIKALNNKKILLFCFPLAISAILNWIQLQGYRVILSYFGYNEMVGVFSVVSGIGNSIMITISLIYSQIFLPKIYQSNGEYISTYLKNALFIIVIILFGCFMFSHEIVSIMTKKEFVYHSNLIFYGVLIESGNFLLGAIFIKFVLIKNTKIVMTCGMISSLITVILFFLLGRYQYITEDLIGIVLVVSQILMLCYAYYQFRKYCMLNKNISNKTELKY